MKELRFKVEDSVFDAIKAQAGEAVPASVMAKTIMENWAVGSSGMDGLPPAVNNGLVLADAVIQKLKVAAEKEGVAIELFLANLLDKVLPNDKMHTVILNIPKGMNVAALTTWFKERVDKIVGKLGSKNV
jgi:hypothetical protein